MTNKSNKNWLGLTPKEHSALLEECGLPSNLNRKVTKKEREAMHPHLKQTKDEKIIERMIYCDIISPETEE
jgi:hypothetical protein|tara:strand:- start:164 stop:376 length:213 start_codon:yes stop_codon:yes gene_type:complete